MRYLNYILVTFVLLSSGCLRVRETENSREKQASSYSAEANKAPTPVGSDSSALPDNTKKTTQNKTTSNPVIKPSTSKTPSTEESKIPEVINPVPTPTTSTGSPDATSSLPYGDLDSEIKEAIRAGFENNTTENNTTENSGTENRETFDNDPEEESPTLEKKHPPINPDPPTPSPVTAPLNPKTLRGSFIIHGMIKKPRTDQVCGNADWLTVDFELVIARPGEKKVGNMAHLTLTPLEQTQEVENCWPKFKDTQILKDLYGNLTYWSDENIDQMGTQPNISIFLEQTSGQEVENVKIRHGVYSFLDAFEIKEK